MKKILSLFVFILLIDGSVSLFAPPKVSFSSLSAVVEGARRNPNLMSSLMLSENKLNARAFSSLGERKFRRQNLGGPRALVKGSSVLSDNFPLNSVALRRLYSVDQGPGLISRMVNGSSSVPVAPQELLDALNCSYSEVSDADFYHICVRLSKMSEKNLLRLWGYECDECDQQTLLVYYLNKYFTYNSAYTTKDDKHVAYIRFPEKERLYQIFKSMMHVLEKGETTPEFLKKALRVDETVETFLRKAFVQLFKSRVHQLDSGSVGIVLSLLQEESKQNVDDIKLFSRGEYIKLCSIEPVEGGGSVITSGGQSRLMGRMETTDMVCTIIVMAIDRLLEGDKSFIYIMDRLNAFDTFLEKVEILEEAEETD